MSAAWLGRRVNYQQAEQVHRAHGRATDNDPLVIFELRTNARDALIANYDRGRWAIGCFAPDVIGASYGCVVRVSPSFLCPTRFIQSEKAPDLLI